MKQYVKWHFNTVLSWRKERLQRKKKEILKFRGIKVKGLCDSNIIRVKGLDVKGFFFVLFLEKHP